MKKIRLYKMSLEVEKKRTECIFFFFVPQPKDLFEIVALAHQPIAGRLKAVKSKEIKYGGIQNIT